MIAAKKYFRCVRFTPPQKKYILYVKSVEQIFISFLALSWWRLELDRDQSNRLKLKFKSPKISLFVIQISSSIT